MIDKDGALRCDGCGKKLGEHLEGKIEMVCPRCHRFAVYDIMEKDKNIFVSQGKKNDA